MLDRHQTLANLVLEHSECADVLRRRALDFCCHGERSIAAAAEAQGLDVPELLAELERAIRDRQGPPAVDPRALSTPRLLAYIVSRHHEYLRRALPAVQALSAKVGKVHGAHNPKLPELAREVDALAQTLIAHLDSEENALFPALQARTLDHPFIQRALAEMVEDHREVGAALGRIRALGDGFIVPDWGCNSYRALFAELSTLEADVFNHVHLENHVLAARFTSSAAEAAR